ncbi:MAG: copper amine oxidase N-terminal domain-containing protein [Candidatus Eremiobacteraeota bacterium]|nr:copper amine oxidase N-terminal domain-containing protein [Candidatus Eremiobacteraeota bacterium]
MTVQRPRLITLTITAAIALAVALGLNLSRPVDVVVDGQQVLTDVAPVTTAADKVYVPLRAVADALGAETKYDVEAGTIVVTRGEQQLRLRVGDTHAKLDGMPMTLKTAPFRVRGRVMVNVKAISRAFGMHVTYDPRTAKIEVNTPGIIEAGAQPEAK